MMRRLLHLAAIVSIVAGGATVAGQQWTPRAGDDRIGKQLLGVPTVAAPSGADAFFDDSVLQEISFDISTKDWETLTTNYLSNEYYPCDFTWNGQKVRNVGIRSRGTGSRSGIKPGLRVDFDRFSTDQKFLGLKSFVLRNNTQDSSNLHERLSMLLYRRLGVPSSREAHTKVYVKGDYAGLYTIVEAVDKHFLKLTYGEDAGYLYKYDYPVDGKPYLFEDKGSDPALYVPLPFKPETHEDNPRPEFIVQWVQAVNQSTSATFRTAVGEYIDFRKLIRHVAVEQFVADYDGFLGDYGMNNFYMYRADPGKMFALIPWDKSQAFLGGLAYAIFHNVDGPSAQRNRLMDRVLLDPDLNSLYLDTLLEIARSAADTTGSTDGRGWLEREVEREYDQIRDAALTDPQKPYSNAEFEQAVNDLRTFARQRSGTVTGQVNQARGVK